MEDKIQLIESGLKCDNPKCNWKDLTIPHTEYHKHVNEPCPKCGENILTEEDYNLAMILHQAVDLVNSMSDEELDKIDLSNVDNLFLSPEDNKKLKENPDKTFRIEVNSHKGIKFNIKDDEK